MCEQTGIGQQRGGVGTDRGTFGIGLTISARVVGHDVMTRGVVRSGVCGSEVRRFVVPGTVIAGVVVAGIEMTGRSAMDCRMRIGLSGGE